MEVPKLVPSDYEWQTGDIIAGTVAIAPPKSLLVVETEKRSGDVGLTQLLDDLTVDNSAPASSVLLSPADQPTRTRRLYHMSTRSDTQPSVPKAVLMDLERYSDSLDAYYLLVEARAHLANALVPASTSSMSSSSLGSLRVDSSTTTRTWKLPSRFSEFFGGDDRVDLRRRHVLVRYIRTTALLHAHQPEVVRACATFLQLRGLSLARRRLCADVAAALILAAGKAAAQTKEPKRSKQTGTKTTKSAAAAAVPLRLAVRLGALQSDALRPGAQQTEAAMAIAQELTQAIAKIGQVQDQRSTLSQACTRLLEAASSSLLPSLRPNDSVAGSPQEQATAVVVRWSKVVSAFRRAHRLPASTEELASLAAEARWPALLARAQAQQIDPAVLHRLVIQHCPESSPVRGHLLSVLRRQCPCCGS